MFDSIDEDIDDIFSNNILDHLKPSQKISQLVESKDSTNDIPIEMSQIEQNTLSFWKNAIFVFWGYKKCSLCEFQIEITERRFDLKDLNEKIIKLGGSYVLGSCPCVFKLILGLQEKKNRPTCCIHIIDDSLNLEDLSRIYQIWIKCSKSLETNNSPLYLYKSLRQERSLPYDPPYQRMATNLWLELCFMDKFRYKDTGICFFEPNHPPLKNLLYDKHGKKKLEILILGSRSNNKKIESGRTCQDEYLWYLGVKSWGANVYTLEDINNNSKLAINLSCILCVGGYNTVLRQIVYLGGSSANILNIKSIELNLIQSFLNFKIPFVSIFWLIQTKNEINIQPFNQFLLNDQISRKLIELLNIHDQQKTLFNNYQYDSSDIRFDIRSTQNHKKNQIILNNNNEYQRTKKIDSGTCKVISSSIKKNFDVAENRNNLVVVCEPTSLLLNFFVKMIKILLKPFGIDSDEIYNTVFMRCIISIDGKCQDSTINDIPFKQNFNEIIETSLICDSTDVNAMNQLYKLITIKNKSYNLDSFIQKVNSYTFTESDYFIKINESSKLTQVLEYIFGFLQLKLKNFLNENIKDVNIKTFLKNLRDCLWESLPEFRVWYKKESFDLVSINDMYFKIINFEFEIFSGSIRKEPLINQTLQKMLCSISIVVAKLLYYSIISHTNDQFMLDNESIKEDIKILARVIDDLESNKTYNQNSYIEGQNQTIDCMGVNKICVQMTENCVIRNSYGSQLALMPIDEEMKNQMFNVSQDFPSLENLENWKKKLHDFD